MKIRSAYQKHERLQLVNNQESMTQQQFKDECDINNILRRYEKTGVLDHMRQNQGQFLDLPGGLDYQMALNMALNAKAAFDALPGHIRARFDNDAQKFLEFMEDEENHEEAVALGLREDEASIPEPDLQAAPAVDEQAGDKPPTQE